MHIRPVAIGDAASVFEVIRARDIADLGAPDYTRADLDSEWAASAVTLDDDARVAELDGAIAGYAIMRYSEALHRSSRRGCRQRAAGLGPRT